MSGLGHWRQNRFSSLVMIPLLLWVLWFGLTLVGLDYPKALSLVSQPLNQVLLATFMIVSDWHASLGLEMIISDYVSDARCSTWATRLCQLGLITIVLVVLFCLIKLQGAV